LRFGLHIFLVKKNNKNNGFAMLFYWLNAVMILFNVFCGFYEH